MQISIGPLIKNKVLSLGSRLQQKNIKWLMFITCIFQLSALVTNSEASAKTQVIRVAVGEWPPFLDSREPGKGVYSELIVEAFKEIGVDVHIEFYPWDTAMTELKNRKVDVSGLWLKNPEREMLFHYSSPVLNETHVLFFNTQKPFQWSEIEEIKGRKLVGITGFSYGSKIDSMVREKQIEMIRVSTDKEAFEMLLKNPEILYPQDLNVGLNSISKDLNQSDRTKIKYHPKIFSLATSFLICAKSNPECSPLILKFNRGLKNVLAKQQGKSLTSRLKSLDP